MISAASVNQDLYIRNLYGLLRHRALIQMSDGEFTGKLEKVKEGYVMSIELKPNPDQGYKSGSLMYVPPGKKLTNLDPIKKTVEKYHLTIIVSGDENIKQIKKKIDTIEAPPISNQIPRRIEVLSLKMLMFDMRVNGHSCLMRKMSTQNKEFIQQKQQVEHGHLPKIEVNDPLVIYYGFEKDDYIIATFPVETCSQGQYELQVIKMTHDSDYFSSVYYI